MKQSSESEDDGPLVLLHDLHTEEQGEGKGQHANEEGADREEGLEETLSLLRGFRC